MAKRLPILALAVGLALTPSFGAQAESHGGGGGGHGGGGYHGGGYHGGGYHGGGYHGDGYHGGDFHGGYHGWGGWYGPGFYPGFGYGYDAYNPFWAYDPSWYEGSAALYAAPPVVSYAPTYSAPADGPAPPPPQYYAPYGQSAGTAANLPTDNSRGFYTWPVGIQSGACNRAYLAQTANNLTGLAPVNLQSGTRLGGIAINPVIRGRIGRNLDMIDQACATEALEHASTGTAVTWQTGNGVPVTLRATRSETPRNGQPCRTFEVTAMIGGAAEKAIGKACRDNETGAWRAAR